MHTDNAKKINKTMRIDDTMLVLPDENCCFHCNEPLPKSPFFSQVLGKQRPMCCMGCKLCADSIVEAGLVQYYLDRQSISATAPVPFIDKDLSSFDHEAVQQKFVYHERGLGVGQKVAQLSVAGLRCTACAWLIETRVGALDGVIVCQVNLTQNRVRVVWDSRIKISDILATMLKIGYDAKPYRQDTHEAMMAKNHKKMLMRLGVAAIGTMQAMMFSVALYFGAAQGIDSTHKELLRYVAWIVCTPVLIYAGAPFFTSAYSALRVRTLNMDVPVAIALSLTYGASVYATLGEGGETYFDSVAMFIFFLLASRTLEHSARLKAVNMASDLVLSTPTLYRVVGHDIVLLDDVHKPIPPMAECQKIANDLVVGDVIWVAAGADAPCDGVLLSEYANVSQSLITGESDLIKKQRGDIILGGSQNDAQPFLMVVRAHTDDSQMGVIDRLMNRALSEKPQLARRADRLARVFVARVLILSVLVWLAWWFVNPAKALWAVVAVLVATCPCALSLATPMALSVATKRLFSGAFLATRGHTVERLSQISHVCFDKTGTLTQGRAHLVKSVLYIDSPIWQGDDDKLSALMQSADGQNTDTQTHSVQMQNLQNLDTQVLAICAALEVGSHHPVAISFLNAAINLHLPNVQNLRHHAGGGVSGDVAGAHFRLGHADFALHSLDDKPAKEYDQAIYLSCNNHKVAVFYFTDSVRADAKDTVHYFKSLGIVPIMLTGDPSDKAYSVANALGIDRVYKGLSPQDKVNKIKQLQNSGARVLMVGDGINDAPVLGSADVSVAMSAASDMAKVVADALILGELGALVDAHAVAMRTQKIITQNLRWALLYNTVVLIPAALGFISPWLAAIGMSLSSLLVVGNAMRIYRQKRMD